MSPEKCRATAKDGQPCGARPVDGVGLCAWHSPAWAAQRLAWSRLGGAAKSAHARARKRMPAELLSTEELAGHLTKVFLDVLGGNAEPRVGLAAATIAKTLTDLAAGAEVARLSEEVAELKSMLARRPA